MHDLLALLADREYHSGESLGEQLGLSRAAIWKQIQNLHEAGVAVESAHGKGYRLQTHVELLDEQRIRRHLPARVAERIELDIRERVDSTNTRLMEAGTGWRPDRVPVCLAETQHAGRGRRGRRWQSPYGTTLPLSVRWQFNSDAGRLAGLSLAAGVAVVQALESLDIQGVQIKWPNDVVYERAKLGGILIELAGDAAGPCSAVIGIGLNISPSTGLNGADAGMSGVDQPWTELLSVHGEFSRNRVAAALVAALLEMLPRFEVDGFAPYRDAYSRYDSLRGCLVDVMHGTHAFTGRAKGVDQNGGLRVECDDGLHTVTSGEVSIRAVSE